MQSKQNSAFQSSQKFHFTHLFPELYPLRASDEQLWALVQGMVEDPSSPRVSSTITNGMAIFSQFLAHDVTFEFGSELVNSQEIHTLQNDRTINLDLDCVYGQRTQDFYYDSDDPDKLLLGKQYQTDDGTWFDLQRNAQQKAIIPDARNDENLIVSRLQATFIRFHNQMVDYIRYQGKTDDIFKVARRRVVWHYHWLILHEYLSRILDRDIYQQLLKYGSRFFRNPRSLPLEFTGAAFRVGHSQVPGITRINNHSQKGLFELGFFTTQEEYVDWRFFFDHGDNLSQFSMLIDPHIQMAFHNIPFIQSDNPMDRSLPFRNLKRGVIYGLPSGEDIAHRYGVQAINVRESRKLGMEGTPLWYYILKEAQELGNGGENLGPVGSLILGECFYTVLVNDDYSFLKVHPRWRPTLGRYPERFDFVDLIQFAESNWGWKRKEELAQVF